MMHLQKCGLPQRSGEDRTFAVAIQSSELLFFMGRRYLTLNR